MTGRAGRCVSMLLAMLLGLLCACGGDAAGSGKERAGNMGRRGKSVGASRKLSQCGCGGVPPPPPPPPPSVDCSSCSSVQYEVSPCDENTGTDRVCASCSNLFCSDGQYRSGCGSGLRGSCLTCERCPQDTYRSGCSGETPGTCVSCADSCPDGQYLAGCSGSSPGACTSCPKCEAGRYLEGCRTSSPGTCVFCPIDSSSPEGSISIEACACNAGYTGAAGSFCSACPAGKFKASNGSWPCTDCSAGTYSTHAATSCIDCPAGSNSPSGSSSCAEVEVCISVFGRNGRTVTVAVGGSDSLGSPRDLQFHPLLPDELWVASAAPDGRLSGNYIIRNPGTPEQTTTLLRDRVAFHYMDNVAAFEFSSDGRALFTCQESVNTYTDLYRGNFFQGPTAFEVYPCHGGYGRAPASYCSEVQTDVSNCVPGDSCEVFTVTHKGESCSGNECFLIHSDMLHEAPNCMGLAYEANATTGPSSLYAPDGLPIDTWNRTRTKGNVVWYMDGVRGRLMRFDLDNLHGTKVIDHRLANVRRYVDVHLSRRENVPGHMAMDSTNKHLYISDTGGGRVLRVKTDSGRFHRGAMCTDHQCYPHENSYWTCGYQTGNAAERGRFVNRSMCQASLACEDTPDLCVRDIENLCRSEDGGWCRYGECAGDDGLGCYNAFTEMGNLFEYELWGCTDYEVFSTAAASPTGISLTPDGLILVADYDSGIIVALDKEGRELNRWSSGIFVMTALELQCAAVPSPSDADCRLWFSNTANKKISYIEVVDACETRPTYKLPSPPALQQACTDPGEPCAADRYKTCQMVTMENRIRPDFEDHNGPSWQDRMVIHHSYGKNCTALPNANQVFNLCTEDDCARIGLDPGGCEGTVQCRVGSNGRVIDATTGATRDWADEDATECPDRTDCHNINPDLLVMAGFFCHPCLPNPCFSGGACNNTGPREGFSCDCLEGFSGHSCQCVLPDRCGPIPPLPNTFARLNSTFVFFCGSCAFYVVEVGRFVTLAKGGKCPTTCTDLFIDGMDDDLLARVTHIAGGTFQDMHGLEHLHISNTRVTEITSHAFKGLPRLATMHLSNNKIERVAPDAFIGLGSMASLVLDHNPLTHTTAADLLRITEAVQGIDIRLPVQYWLRKFDEVDAWKGNAGNYDLPVNRVTVEWGDPKYSRCEQPYSWYELKRGYKERMITFKTGGLGRLLDTEHEAWLCLPDHPCADVGDWFCFVYNEVTKIFIPWGTNRELGILQLS